MRTAKEKKIRAGFTLVELLVVIAIIALLLSILMPSLQRAREQARMLLCKTNIRQISLCINMYAQENRNVYPPQRKSFASNDWWFAPESNILTPYFGEKTSMRKVTQYGCLSSKNDYMLYNPVTKKSDEIDYTVSGHLMPYFDAASAKKPWNTAKLSDFVKRDVVKHPSEKMLVADIGPKTYVASFWNTLKKDNTGAVTIGTPHKGTNIGLADFSVGFFKKEIMDKMLLVERETGVLTDKYIHAFR